MKIGFEAKKIFKNHTGLGNYARTLVANYAKFYPQDECVLYSTHPSKINEFDKLPNVSLFVCDALFKWYWRSKSVINQLKKDNINLYHGTSNELPIGIKNSGIKSVVTIHDLIFKIYPNTYNFFDRLIYDFKFKYACRNADKIIAISQQTKEDVVKLYNIDKSRIEVIYQSCNSVFFDEKKLNFDRLKKYNFPEKYNLYVGTINERKNLKSVIKAYDLLPDDNKIPLVVVGNGKKYKHQCVELARKLNLSQYFIWVGDLDENEDLKCAYQNAQIFIYSSVYEGFGIPVLEAMLCKTPVITSNISSFPEVTGGNAVHVNPTSEKEIAEAIEKLLNQKEFRNNLVEKAYDYAVSNFSAEVTSEKLHQLYTSLRNE